MRRGFEHNLAEKFLSFCSLKAVSQIQFLQNVYRSTVKPRCSLKY
jgi:hypothetical protein